MLSNYKLKNYFHNKATVYTYIITMNKAQKNNKSHVKFNIECMLYFVTMNKVFSFVFFYIYIYRLGLVYFALP